MEFRVWFVSTKAEVTNIRPRITLIWSVAVSMCFFALCCDQILYGISPVLNACYFVHARSINYFLFPCLRSRTQPLEPRGCSTRGPAIEEASSEGQEAGLKYAAAQLRSSVAVVRQGQHREPPCLTSSSAVHGRISPH